MTRFRQIKEPKPEVLNRITERITIDVETGILERALNLRGGLPVSVLFSEALYLWVMNHENRPASWPTVVVPVRKEQA